MTSAPNDEDKYTLDYFPQGGRTGDDEPPFKYRTFYLDDALAEAWRITRDGGSALRIKRRDEPALEEAELKALLEKMSKLEGEQSGRGERELAALALEHSGESASASPDAESVSEESGDDVAKSKGASAGAVEVESPS